MKTTTTIIAYYDELGNVTCTEYLNENKQVIKRETPDYIEEFIRNDLGLIVDYKCSDGYSHKLSKNTEEVINEIENNRKRFDKNNDTFNIGK